MIPTQLIEFLNYTIPARMPVLITGKPGIGKSEIVSQVVENLKQELIIFHPVVDDPTDYKGMPYVDKNGASFIAFDNLNKLINATNPIVCFFDDLGQALPSVQAALMQVVLAREISGKNISDLVTFVAATNGRNDGAAVSGMLEPLKSRFTIVELEQTVESWSNWALNTDFIPVELIGAVNFQPDWINKWTPTRDIENSPCPRNLTKVAELMNLDMPEQLHYEAFKGRLGAAAALTLVEYLKIASNLPNINEIFTNPMSVPVVHRQDLKYACTMAIASKVQTSSEFMNANKYIKQFGHEFESLFVNTVSNLKPELKETDVYMDWTLKIAS